MSLRAKTYITLTAMLGVLILQHAPAELHSEDGFRLLCYLTCAVLTSQLKVRLPGITGTMSVNFFFIMLAIIEMDLRPVLIITSAGTLSQMLWHARKRPQLMQMVFNLASVIIASYCAYTVYHGHLPPAFAGTLPVLLFASTVVFFLVNTLTVSGISGAHREQEPVGRVARELRVDCRSIPGCGGAGRNRPRCVPAGRMAYRASVAPRRLPGLSLL